MNLTHRTINNAAFNVLGWVLPMGLSFLILPYIVQKLGTDAYGILTLVLTVIGYFTLLDLGLGNAVIKYVAEYNAEGSPEKTNAVIGAALLMFLALGLIGGIAILLIARLLATKFFGIPPRLVPIAYSAFCMGSVGFFLTMLLSVFSAIPNGLNRYDITSMVSVILGAFTTLTTAFLLCAGFGLLQIVVLNVFVSLVGIIIYAYILKRLLPTIRFMPVLKLSVIRKVIHFGLFSLLSRLSYMITYRADRVITGAILGASWVTYYVVPCMIVNRVTTITVRIGMVIFPAISELQGRQQYDKITDLYLASSRVIIAVATSVCLPLLFFGGRLMTLWMGPDFGEKSGMVIFLITLGLYLNAFTNVPSFVVNGVGRPKITGISSLCNAFLNLALAIPLAKYMGINGVSTAFLISNICVSPVFTWYVNNKVVRIPMLRLLREAYAKPLFAGLLMVIPLSFFPQELIHNLCVLLLVVIMFSAAYFGVCASIGVFPRHEKKLLYDYMRKVFKGIKNIKAFAIASRE